MRRAGVGACPYRGQKNDPVDMIRHHDECIYIEAGIMSGQFLPHRFDHPPDFVQRHFAIHDFPKETFSILRADGDKIGPSLRVIISSQPD